MNHHSTAPWAFFTSTLAMAASRESSVMPEKFEKKWNDIIEELIDLDMERKPESLWWTSVYMAEDGVTFKVGGKDGRCRSLRSSICLDIAFVDMVEVLKVGEDTENMNGKLVEGWAHPSREECVSEDRM